MVSGYRMGQRAVLLAILLLTSLAVGAAAQSTGPASDGFTGQSYVGDCGESGGTFEIVDGVEQFHGFRCEGHIGSSDPRLTGTYVSVANIDTYRGADFAPHEGAFNVWTIVRRVENDEGAWQGEATTAVWVDDPDTWFIADPPATVVFTGEGGYAGLTAAVTFTERMVQAGMTGYIFAGSPPPAPSITE